MSPCVVFFMMYFLCVCDKCMMLMYIMMFNVINANIILG
jgi:hypothetical protein